jgi:hypothetical protein
MRQMSVIKSNFVSTLTKIPDTNNLRGKGFIFNHSFRDFNSQLLAPLFLGPEYGRMV